MNQWHVEIRYCAQCRWLLRASWLAQELLTTFTDGSLAQVSLIPDFTGGVFRISVGSQRVWCRSERGRFPEAAELKRAVRDIIAPDQTLGHSEGVNARQGERVGGVQLSADDAAWGGDSSTEPTRQSSSRHTRPSTGYGDVDSRPSSLAESEG